MPSPITELRNFVDAIIEDAINTGEQPERTIERIRDSVNIEDLARKCYDYGLQRRHRQWKDATQDVSCQQLGFDDVPSWMVAIGLPQGIVTPDGKSKLTRHAEGEETWQFINDREVESAAIHRANTLSREGWDKTRRISAENGIDFHDNNCVIMRKVAQLEMFGG